MASRLHGGNTRHPDVIDAQMGYADALQLGGDLLGAALQMREAVANAEQVFGRDSMMVGFFLRPLAEVERELGQLDDAIRDAQRSLAIGDAPGSPPAVAHANRLMTLGRAQLDARRIDGAVSSLSQALQIRLTLHDADRRWAVQAAYASALLQAGDLAAAEKLLGEIPLDTAQLPAADRIRALRTVGMLRARKGRSRDALVYFDRAASIAIAQADVDAQLERAETLSEAGAERYAIGDADEAADQLEAAVRILAARQKVPTPARAEALSRLARARIAQSRMDDARGLLQEADAFWRSFDPANPRATEAARLRASLTQDR
jgi:tetratricopeptide (TPR) repeat protein